MAKWELLIDGTTLDLSGPGPVHLVSVLGTGLPPIRRFSQAGPLQNGETDLGFRFEARLLNLVFLASAGTLAETDAARDLLAFVLGPRQERSLLFRATRDDGEVRRIACLPLGSIDFPNAQDDRWGARQRVALQLVAPDPAWEEEEESLLTWGLLNLALGFVVPWPVPFTSGLTPSSGIDLGAVVYAGTMDAYPLISVYGPITSPVVENATTGARLSFPGLVLEEGETLEIDLAYGKKSVLFAQTGESLLSYLSPDSDLASWSLRSSLELGGAGNSLRFSGTALGPTSKIEMRFRRRFLSL